MNSIAMEDEAKFMTMDHDTEEVSALTLEQLELIAGGECVVNTL